MMQFQDQQGTMGILPFKCAGEWKSMVFYCC
jgi:hypothetical protein